MILLAVLVLVGVLLFNYASLVVSTMSFAIVLSLLSLFSMGHAFALTLSWAIFLGVAVILNFRPLRMQLMTRFIFKIFKKQIPKMSETERAAIEAGNTGWEAEFFRGRPNWESFSSTKNPRLTKEEQDFIDGPVEKLCSMCDDWQITQYEKRVPNNVWKFIRENRFFSMIIPKEYGGLAFSAYAQSCIVIKLAGCNVSVATSVCVPNSLGPAELLMHYGTEKQKNYYLPRLAKGDEVPCFGLTSPTAGSDAASIIDRGVVTKGVFDGKEVVGVRLNWNKRYITLAPVATLIGLAFKLFDPEHLLSQEEERGITLALIPHDLPGITIGRRHCPLMALFANGPMQGADVFIPIEMIIGGEAQIGQGWRMLMQCLAAGRCISLPGISTGGARFYSTATAAYARMRCQFGVPIHAFDGIREPLSRMLGFTYAMESMRTFTANSVDMGCKSGVASAICKYHVTEMGRQVIIDGVDIQGGKAICLGPKNYIASTFASCPISITVEGANILTRNLIIFGQGAIRCHPYILKEMQAVTNNIGRAAVKGLDSLIYKHLGFILSNTVRTPLLALTQGHLGWHPKTKDPAVAAVYRQILRFSSAFALMTDLCMISLGSSLKRLECLSARLGDVLSSLYMLTACIKFYESADSDGSEKPVFEWATQYLLQYCERQMSGLIDNLPSKVMRVCCRILVFPVGRRCKGPSDRLNSAVVDQFIQPSAVRERIMNNLYTSPDDNNPGGRLLADLHIIIEAEPLERKLRKAMKTGQITGLTLEDQLQSARAVDLFTEQEQEIISNANAVRLEHCAVDDFSLEELQGNFAKYSAANVKEES